MGDIAIRVEGLSKQYRIGKHEKYRTLRDTLAETFTAPFKRAYGLLRGNAAAAGNLNETIWALKDVSFEVKKGEVIGIIGRNGAGKSTLLKILSRITGPTKGRVEIYGRVGALLEVGTGFHPELTGRENIYLNAAILGMSRAEISRKFDEIVAFAEVEKFIDTPVKHYSSGMGLRLGFAVAAHLEPEILIVDEVLAVGDVAFQKKCLGKMGQVAGEGRTVLFVSHNMAAVRNLCSHTILLENGRILTSGPTEEVIAQYLRDSSKDITPTIVLPMSPTDVQIRNVVLKFSSQDGVPQTEFQLREPWRVTLDFELFRATPHCMVAVALQTLEGVVIATYWSKPQDLAPDKYSVEFNVDLPLQAGYIQFIIGISTYERTFYYVENVGQVSISELALVDQPVRASGTGLLLTPSQVAEIKPSEWSVNYLTLKNPGIQDR
jgi:lipopolysaccharide transport system ATP-binding protein